MVEAIQAIQKGKMPSNDQITSGIDATTQAIEERRKEVALNAHGDTLALDAEKTLKLAKEFLEEKNEDEVLQDLFYKSKKSALEAKTKALKIKDDVEKKVEDGTKEVKEEAQDLVYIGKRVAYEVVKSRDFRRLLLETVQLLQSVFFTELDKAEDRKDKIVKAVKKDAKEKDVTAKKTVKAAESVAKDIKEDFKEGIIPQEEKDKLWERCEKILRKIQSNDDYKQAVNGIFSLFDTLKEKVETFEVDPKLKEDLKHNKNAEDAWKDVKTIIERFSGEGTVDPILKDIKKLYEAISKDARAKSIIKDGRELVLKSFKNPKVLKDESFRKQFDSVFEKSRSLTNDKRYSKLWNRIFKETGTLLEAIKDDQISNDLGDSIKKFASDIVLDSDGKVSIGGIQDSLGQLKTLLVPVITKQLTQIPVARIDGSTDKYDFAAKDVVFSAYDVLPDYFKLYFQTMLNVDLKQATTDTAKAFLRLELNNIRAHLKDVHFAYRRKVFPQIEDEGRADIDLGGKGMSVAIDWVVSTGKKEETAFRIKNVDVSIDDLTVTIKQANHDILDKIAVKVFNKQMKNEIEDELEVQLKYFGRWIADNINEAFLSIPKQVEKVAEPLTNALKN